MNASGSDLAAFAFASVLVLAVAVWVIRGRTLYAMQGGAFDVQPADAGRFRFRSDFGLIELDFDKDRLTLIGPASSRVFPETHVRCIQLHVVEKLLDRWQEFLVSFHFQLLGTHFRDRVVWQVVVAELDDGSEVPLYAAGQLRRIEPFTTWLLDLNLALLQRLGIAPDVPKIARGVREELAGRFAAWTRTGATPD